MLHRFPQLLSLIACTLAALAGRSPVVAASPQVRLATPMHKIMIQGELEGFPFESWEADRYDLSLARNEHEAFQIVVVPDSALTNVNVGVSDLQGQGGAGAFNGEVQVWLVGHVDAADDPIDNLNVDYPPYLDDYTGWWPDPLLTFQQTCDIDAGERVSFWIDIATKADTLPGDYEGTVTVTADGSDPVTVQLNVHVWDIEIPAKPTLPTAFSIDSLWQASWVYGSDWSNEIRNKFYAMHQDHRLSVTEIYNNHPRATSWFDPWLPLNNAFCLSRVPTPDPNGLTTLYNYFTGLGRLDEAYVYGFDEEPLSKFQEMYDAFSWIHEFYPGLRTMTTAYDSSFGTSQATSYVRPVVDIWVPTTPVYDTAAAEALRAEGKDMWWYIAVYPRHPYANWLLEYPAIEARLLMGAMTFKYDAGGFLYYAVTNWGYKPWLDGLIAKNRPITFGPYTEWDPRVSWQASKNGWVDGDGSLYYAGPVDVGPLPTIRLENIRDGLEDYEYLNLLEQVVSLLKYCHATPQQEQFINEANALLAVPGSVVSSVLSYTRSHEDLYAYRQQIAEAILAGRELAEAGPIPVDGDGDGIGDDCDNCPSDYNPDQADLDDDQVGDVCDDDVDGDGTNDDDDNCPRDYNEDQLDADHDGVGDVCDNCPSDSNSDQADTDYDGLGNVCDNCPDRPNPDQTDSDGDGIGNHCDNTPYSSSWLYEKFDGTMTGDDQVGSWDQASMEARWPLTWGGSGGGFAPGEGENPAGAAMNTKKIAYRMTTDLEPDMSGYGPGNIGIGPGNAINGTDERPLILEFVIDFNLDSYGGYSNFYIELSFDGDSGDDQAPRDGMATEDPDLSNGDQGPWTDGSVHWVLAYGSFAAINLPASQVPLSGTKGAPMYYDGLRWHYTKMMTDVNGDPVDLWKRQDGGPSLFRITIKTDTVVMEIDNLGGSPSNEAHEVPRLYKGPFNRLSMTMGNTVDTGRKSYVDNILLAQGDVWPLIAEGGCCVATDVGTGTCEVTSQNECESLLGGTYLGDFIYCGANEDTDSDGFVDVCDNCPNDPLNDRDGDGVCGDVDNCPDDANADQADSDQDGIGDVCDPFEGACCIDTGVGPIICSVTSRDNCENTLGGIYAGDFTVCGPHNENCDFCPDDPDKTEPGICGCGVADTDTDQDGTPDCNDECPDDPNKTEPGSAGCGVAEPDTGKEGEPEVEDQCPDDPNKTEPGECGCGTPDDDTDGDGTPDCNDICPKDANKLLPGVCGCGTPDDDTDGDGTPDCNDNCLNDPSKVLPGVCGCGVPDTDTDGDGTPDCVDNCPHHANPGQADADADGLGDACDSAGSTSSTESPIPAFIPNCGWGVVQTLTLSFLGLLMLHFAVRRRGS